MKIILYYVLLLCVSVSVLQTKVKDYWRTIVNKVINVLTLIKISSVLKLWCLLLNSFKVPLYKFVFRVLVQGYTFYSKHAFTLNMKHPEHRRLRRPGSVKEQKYVSCKMNTIPGAKYYAKCCEHENEICRKRASQETKREVKIFITILREMRRG